MISDLWENIQNIFWNLFQGFWKKKKKGFRKAKIVLWNAQFPILSTYETIFKLFYYLYYTAYLTEIDLFDVQYKDNDFIKYMTLSPFGYVGGGPMSGGGVQ